MPPHYFRIGRIVYRAATNRNVPVLTCANEFLAALRVREFNRRQGGNR